MIRLQTPAQQPNGALVVAPTAVTLLHRDLIIALAARHRLPAVYPYRYFATSGGSRRAVVVMLSPAMNRIVPLFALLLALAVWLFAYLPLLDSTGE